MIFATWNIRGFHRPLKQNGIVHLIHSQNVDVCGILETKCNRSMVRRFVENKLNGWSFDDNFDTIAGGRILLVWNPLKVEVNVVQKHPQSIHCIVKCKISSISFRSSIVYAHNTLVQRRLLWADLENFSGQFSAPWIVLGDFNNVLKYNERCNGRDVTPYEIRDFEDCCNALGLSDMQSAGCFFTWSNNRVLCKLDRALVNNQWLMLGTHSLANFLPAGCISDHSPCIASLFLQDFSSRKPFKFFNLWSDHCDFLQTVIDGWDPYIFGTAQFVLVKQLKGLQRHLKRLNERHFSHISERTKRAKHLLTEAEIRIQADPSNPVLLNDIIPLRKNALILGQAERSFYQQKAKSSFIFNSDRCTKFFHAVVKRNHKKNFIAAINLPDGSLTTSREQVINAFVDHFQALLGTCLDTQPISDDVLTYGPGISAEQSDQILSHITEDEIKGALNDIGGDKAPGPDGYSSHFFKSAWAFVGNPVVAAVQEFFQNTSLLKQINHTVIALIPKSSHATSVGDFRPIACCNVIYKIISKILASRLSPLLNDLVDRAQSAFVPGRLMSDNVHLMQELLRGYNRKRSSPRCIIKIDLRKAFDSISWDFLAAVLKGLSFPQCFIDWVMECVSSPSYSVSINGGIHGFFKGKKGLRQGDPLSPYLFVLCLEYLSRLIKKATNNSAFNFHPKCGALKITHLAFADDLMLLARGDQTSIEILMECLRDFGSRSGLHLNVLKSNIYLAGIQGQIMEDIHSSTHLIRGSMPFRYLGIPLAATSLKVMHFGPLLDSISSAINCWTGSALSYAGRVELIRTVLQGIESFWLSIFPIPAAVQAKMIKLCRSFLWGSKRALVAWKDICLPKSEGGLGIRDIKAWNSALLSKLLWNISEKKDSLWIQWVNHIYLRDRSVWDFEVHKRDSSLFKRIFAIRDRLRHQTLDGTTLLSRWFMGLAKPNETAYDFFRPSAPRLVWASLVWSAYITPKHAFILWLGIKGKLNTKNRLVFLDVDQTCAFCSTHNETVQHLFFGCNLSASVWNCIRGWLGINRAMTTIDSAIKWLKKEARGTAWFNKAKKIALACTVYHLWTARNAKIFEGQIPQPRVIVHKIQTHVFRTIFALYPHLCSDDELFHH